MGTIRLLPKGWRNGEKGLGEIFSTIFILPLVVALLFVLVELGYNMRYRMAVDGVVHDAIRSVAAEGTAGCPPPWSSLRPATDATVCPVSSTTWEARAQAKLRELCGSGNARCTSTASSQLYVRCTPTRYPASTTNIAPDPGVLVRCTARFPYRNLVNFTVANRTFNLGFGALWSDPIVYTAETYTMIGSGE